jgi:hypothetical protein
MNKQTARKKSREGLLSVGELRIMIRSAKNRGGLSQVNPQFTLKQTCDIFENALADREDSEIPSGMRLDVYKNRMVPSRDSLIIYNILRDCS